MVKEWDVVTMRDAPLSSFSCKGLVQAIAISHHNDDMIYVGTTSKAIYCFDRRAPVGDDENAGCWNNDSMVNTVCLSNDGTMLTSGEESVLPSFSLSFFLFRCVVYKKKGGG